MATYIISIGGSGARVMRSFLFLAAGNNQSLQNTEIKILAIDSDTVIDSAQAKFIDVYHNYQRMHELRGDSTFFPCKISVTTHNPTSENGGENQLTFIRYLTENIGLEENNDENIYDASFLKLFFPEDGLSMNIQKGFYGSPNIGGVVFASTPNLRSSVEEWMNGFDSENDKIIILGSLFGGVGAAGIPQIVNIIRESDIVNLNQAALNGIFVLPYFNLRDNPSVNGKFLGKTKSALQYYESRLNDKFAKILYIGETPPSVTYENRPDGNYNSPHQVDLFAALGVIHIMNNSLREGRFYEYWRKNPNEAAKTDLSHIILQNDVDKNSWNSFVSFSFLLNYFYNEFGKLNGEIYNDAYKKIANFFNDTAVKQFKGYYLSWLSELKEGGFAPFGELGNEKNYSSFMMSLSNHFTSLNSRNVFWGMRRPLLTWFRKHQDYLKDENSTVLKFLDLAFSSFPKLPRNNVIGNNKKRYIVYANDEIDPDHTGAWDAVGLRPNWGGQINANNNNEAIRISASIPTMFAQIYLYKSAFENNDLNLYSDVLDMMELIYAYPDKIKLDIWYRGNDGRNGRVENLKRRGYSRLAGVIDTFWSRDLPNDKEMVLIYYIDDKNTEHLLGGVSSINLFFISPNWMGSKGQREVSRYQRMADNNMPYHLFIAPSDDAPNRELRDRNHAFRDYVRQLFSQNDDLPLVTYVRDQLEAVGNANADNMELLEILVKFVKRESDHEFLQHFYVENKLFLHNHLAQLCPVSTDGHFKYLVWGDDEPAKISIADIFEDELLYLESGVVDEDNFEYPKVEGDVNYLLPLKKAFFDVFALSDMTVSGSKADGYFFQVRKKIKERTLLLSRMFQVRNVNVIATLNLSVFPAYKSPKKRWVFLGGDNLELDVTVGNENVGFRRGEKNEKLYEIFGNDGNNLTETSLKYIHVTRIDADKRMTTGKGILVPRYVEVQEKVAEIAIDFGTTNTQFAWKSDDSIILDFTDTTKLSLNLLRNPLDKDIINRQFIPYNSHFLNPFKSIMLNHNTNTNATLFDSTSIAWNPANFSGDYVFNVKWDITNASHFDAMLRELIAVADAINTKAKILVTYPFAMGDLDLYKEKWQRIAKEFGSTIQIDISESVAPLFYFAPEGGDGFINVDIGGMTADIALFSPAMGRIDDNIATRKNYSASFKFGANYLWKNSVWKNYIDAELQEYMDGEHPEDVMSFFFSQDNPNSLTDPLRSRENRDNRHRGLLIHFLAISYMIGKILKAKKNELIPKGDRTFKVAFTGNGSKYLRYLGSSDELGNVFTEFIMAAFPELKGNTFTFNLDDVVKEATAKGRLKASQNVEFKETHVVIIGDKFADTLNSRMIKVGELNNVLSETKGDFDNFFEALSSNKEIVMNNLSINITDDLSGLKGIGNARFDNVKRRLTDYPWDADYMDSLGMNGQDNEYRFNDSPFWDGITKVIEHLLKG